MTTVAPARAAASSRDTSHLPADLATVHVGIFDSGGVLRSKRLPRAEAARAAREGWTFIDAIQWWDHADATVAARAWREAPATLDLTSLRRFPFEPSAGVLLADFDGELGALSFRTQLRRAAGEADRLGLTVRAGFEVEFIALGATSTQLAAEGWATLPPVAFANRCWSTLTPATDSDVLTGLEAVLRDGDVALHHLCSELGPGCWEMATGTTDVLRAADDAGLAKLWVKAFFARRGQAATFMAKLSEQHPGLGGHPIVSLQHGAGGPGGVAGVGGGLFAAPGVLSPLGRGAVAGVLDAMGDLMPLYAPTVNSYRRLAPGNWAPATRSWGVGNYTCALRVVERPGEDRLELRIPGADADPHAAFTGLLASALRGIRLGLEPPPPHTDDARRAAGPPGIPLSLPDAADRMERSDVARELLGDAAVAHVVARARAEHDAMASRVPPHERARYFDHV